MTRRLVQAAAALATMLSVVSEASGQSGGGSAVQSQLWGNFTFDYPKGEDWLLETDFEPKILLSGGEKWRSLDVTPLVEYYPHKLLDLTAEVDLGFTHQFNDLDTTAVTPRLGFRLNFLNNLRERGRLPKGPLQRIRIATLVRFEYRNFWYSDGEPSSHQWRFRARLESKAGITREDISKDRTLYGIYDVEWFVPLGGEVTERYVSKVRMRAGLGYRFLYGTRLEVLYIHEWQRKSPGAPKESSADILDIRLKFFF